MSIVQSIKSYNESNSVKVIAFAMYFSKRLSQHEIDSLVDTIYNTEYFIQEFNSIDKQQEISMTITPDGTPKHTQSVGGIVSSKLNAKKTPTWTLELNKDLLLVTCRAYSRWEPVSHKAFSHIDEIFKIIQDSYSRIDNLTLEYLDEFIVLNKMEEWKRVLFKDNCKYLLANFYDLDDYWHINHGCFLKIDNVEAKVLDTYGINFFADEQDNMIEKVNIRMQHKVLFDSNSSLNKEKIEDVFSQVHIHSKNIFESIVSDKILETFNRGN